MPAGARLAAVEIALQIVQRQLQPGRATVDDGHQRRTMAFAGSGDGEQLAVGIAGHAGRSAIDRKTGAGSIPEAATVSSLLLPAHTDLCVDCRVQPAQ